MSTTKSIEELMQMHVAETATTEVKPEEVKKVEEQPKTLDEKAAEVLEKAVGSQPANGATNMPSGGMDALTALVSNMEEEAVQAKNTMEEALKQQEIETRKLDEEEVKEAIKAKSSYQDEIVEVKEDEEENETEVVKEKVSEEPLEDLSNLKIMKITKSKTAKDKYSRILEARKQAIKDKAYTGVLSNSGYSAKFTGFTSPELNNISVNLESNDIFNGTDYLYKKIHEHMADTSVGKMNYIEFLKCTSLLELNTIYYCLFNGTYPSENEYPATCVNEDCKHEFNFVYPNSKLMYLPDNDEDRAKTTAEIMQVIKAENPQDLLAKSKVNTLLRKKLSSGTIVDFRHPSLYNHLNDTIAKLDEKIVGEDRTIINLMPFIENVYVYSSEDDAYLSLEEFGDKLQELFYMDDEDLETCVEVVSQISKSYKIKFGFKGLKCPHCGKVQPDQEIEQVSSLIFLLHQVKMKGKL